MRFIKEYKGQSIFQEPQGYYIKGTAVKSHYSTLKATQAKVNNNLFNTAVKEYLA